MDYKIIKIDKKNYPVRFGMAAMMTFTKLTNKGLNDLQTMGDNMNIEEALALCYAGLKQGARKAGQSFDLTLEEVGDLFDADQNGFIEIMAAFSEAYEVEAEPGNAKGDKKSPKK